MTLLFIDGAQGYNTAQINRKWAANSSAAVNATGGRRSGPSIRFDDWADNVRADAASNGSPVFPNDATFILGFAIKVSALPASTARSILGLYDTATPHITISLKSDGTLQATRGQFNGPVLGTTTAVLTPGTFAYIEVKVLVSDTVGTVDIRKDGISILALTAQDTRNGASAQINRFFLGDPTATQTEAVTVDFDDIYACNGAGSAPQNTFLGDCRVDTTFPNGAGNLSQWTPSAGSNWQNVDEDPANDDTDYNFASVAATRDLYALPDIAPTTGTVFGVSVNLQVRKDDAAARTFRDLVRSGSTNFPGALTHTAQATYNMYTEIHAVDPNTSAAWTIANINLAEFGIDLVS